MGKRTSSGPPHPACSTMVWDKSLRQLLKQSVCITKEFLHKLSETTSRSSSTCFSSSSGSQAVSFVIVTDLSGKCSHVMPSGMFEKCYFHKWIPIYAVQGRWQSVWVRFFFSCKCCGSSGLWWQWGCGMGRCTSWTKNEGAFYAWHFKCDTVTRS